MPKLEETQQMPGRHARRARSLRVSSSLAEINVVPLVDVMLVLLVIFMVTAPMMTEGFQLKLPQARRSTAIDAPLTISVPLSFRKDSKVRFKTEWISVDALGARIRAELNDQPNKNVIVAGDGGIMLQELTQITDKLKEGGVVQVGLQTQPVIAAQD
jgi:biopolymer transport protein ExbD